jgi:hypothetical protein
VGETLIWGVNAVVGGMTDVEYKNFLSLDGSLILQAIR